MQGRRGEFAFALFLLAVGITVIVGALQVNAPATANIIGPRIAPLAVGIFVTALAAITVGTVIFRTMRSTTALAVAPSEGDRGSAAPAPAHDEVPRQAESLRTGPAAHGERAPAATQVDLADTDTDTDTDTDVDAAEAAVDIADVDVDPVQSDGPADIATIAWCCVIMVIFGLVLTTLGFLIAAFGLFLGLARVLGSRRWVTDVIVAAAVSAGLYFGFSYVLGVALPAGLI